MSAPSDTAVVVRSHGPTTLPTLVYLPGIHGDWTLITRFRKALTGRLRLVEITYPRNCVWSLADYAGAIECALLEHGVTAGWLLGESFGSQPAWELIGRQQRNASQLKFHGLILAGGFVKHPWPWGALLLRSLHQTIPMGVWRRLLRAYGLYANWREQPDADAAASIVEFIARRLHPDDIKAMEHRYGLVAREDVRPIAAQCTVPVFHLAGLVDPIVPAPQVRHWLKRHCPGFEAGRTLCRADHNVLSTASQTAADLICAWMQQARA